MQLTDEQQYVVKKVLKFEKNIISVGGCAGTGKSTIISHLVNILPKFSVCAYTGKAANVLRKKGVKSSTIHSLIYEPIQLPDNTVEFYLRDSLECEGIIVDEASMISSDIYSDLVSFDLPIIFVGDHCQLEPIGEDIGLMKKPDYILEKIHRNAGEIAHFAEYIRNGYRPKALENRGFSKITFLSSIPKKLADFDQIICAFNKTRVAINRSVREELGYSGDWPQVGERVICLKNNKNLGIFNGMQGIVEKLYALPKNRMCFYADDMRHDLLFDPKCFGKEKNDFSKFSKTDPNPFDWAYCNTCHKMQGSEDDKICVIEQKCDLWDHRRWAYTAASRAREHLTWIAN